MTSLQTMQFFVFHRDRLLIGDENARRMLDSVGDDAVQDVEVRGIYYGTGYPMKVMIPRGEIIDAIKRW